MVFGRFRRSGALSRDDFRSALRTTLIKEPADVPTFDRLFPLYFGVDAPPMQPATDGMSEEQQHELRDALDRCRRSWPTCCERLLDGQLTPKRWSSCASSLQRAQQNSSRPAAASAAMPAGTELQQLMEQLTQAMMNRLAQLLNWLLSGEGPKRRADCEQIGKEVGLPRANHPYQQQALTERMLRAMGMEQLQELLEKLMQQLSAGRGGPGDSAADGRDGPGQCRGAGRAGQPVRWRQSSPAR